jgi:hypothetical protein
MEKQILGNITDEAQLSQLLGTKSVQFIMQARGGPFIIVIIL